MEGGHTSEGARNLASERLLIPNYPYFSLEDAESFKVLVMFLGARACEPHEGQGQKVTWGSRQHHSPVAFHTVPLPEVQ